MQYEFGGFTHTDLLKKQCKMGKYWHTVSQSYDSFTPVCCSLCTLPSATTLNSLKFVFKPQQRVYLVAFNAHTLKQAAQQVALVHTDGCYFHKIQDSTTMTAPSLSSRYQLRTCGDAKYAVAGYTGVGIVLSDREEASLLD
ncbi:LOW QUALITY PROTEIN: hypothetical protein T265_13115 [Opisthorchis viverrini]|uniref:Uncharacterized protein n=1 Tax=Opisthorchis viverrini TaxID=6198 RepID=A0A075AHZ5_OPIVI|nr:LOW QUALITY PROTEIN: hypothetical protein T265_13115 [Opisthorchis viverrini]KER30744.1 LOW QUALITY PROTEIN: hypothetical protein T265_13115 [Opisthorchis viverrini]